MIHLSTGGSYIQAAIESWGISDEQLIKNVACRMRDKLSGETGMTWPPYIDDLETSEEPNVLLQKFLTWLKNPAVSDLSHDCSDPTISALASLV